MSNERGDIVMVVNYLRRRLGLSPEQADELEPLAYAAVRAYLTDTDPNLGDMDIDDLDVKLRLERPFITGYLVREALNDPGLDQVVVDRIILDAFGNIDLEEYAEDAFPAFMITLFHHVVRLRGPDRELLEMVLIAYDLHPEVLVASDPNHFVSLFDSVVASRAAKGPGASVMLGVMLSTAEPSWGISGQLVGSYLRSRTVPTKEKRRFSASVIDGSYTQRFWADRLREVDLIDSRTIDVPSEIHGDISAVVLPWLRENTPDKERMIRDYLGADPSHLGAPSKMTAAMTLVQGFGDDLTNEFSRWAISEASSFPDPEVRRAALDAGYSIFGEGFNKELLQ